MKLMAARRETDFRKDPCPACYGSGFERTERGVRPCECVEAARRARLLDEARIPRRFEAATFSTFVADTPSLERALSNAQAFVSQYPDVDCGLLFLGDPGVGKTHLAVSALRSLIARGVPGVFYDSTDLLKEIQDSYNPVTLSSELSVLAPIFEVEVLLLDELGAAKPTEWAAETMTYVINRRYNDRKITIFTSNYLDSRTGRVSGETLTERIGPRLRSRLHEMCRLVTIAGPDYRESIKKRRGGKLA